MKKKTYKDWQKSELDLDKYLGIGPCEIDEKLSNYIGSCTAPKYCSQGLIQGGDAEKEEDGVLFYFTVSHVNDKNYYLGILPEFQQ